MANCVCVNQVVFGKPNQNGSCQRIRILLVISLLNLVSDFQGSGPTLLVACSSLRSNTEPEDEIEAALFPEACSASHLNESSDSNVEDELVPELADTLERQEQRNCPS